MKRTLIALSLILLAIASIAVAQQRRGPAAPPVPLGTPQTFTGTVISFAATVGAMYPSLLVSEGSVQKSFILGPYWFLTDSKFVAKAGDRVTVTSLSCPECVSGDAVISVANLTNGSKLVLRDNNGLPLWQNGQSRGGRGSRNGGRGQGGPGGAYGICGGVLPDMTRSASFEGTVVSFTGGPGVGHPELTLATIDGNKVLVPSPYHVLMIVGYTFTPGSKLAVTAAPVVEDDEEEWVVITMKDLASGLELIFRDATGAPIGGRGFAGQRP